jgi:hypothetical protein
MFSALVIGILAFLAWWLYLSPIRQAAANGTAATVQQNKAAAISKRLSYTLALLIGVGSMLISFGGYWDASEHVVTGIVPGGEDFLWPPHLMLYGGFLLAFVVALGGLIALALNSLRLGIKDPRLWVRRNPYVGAVVLIAGYGLLSIPGDAIWHELYGVDLTAWSAPHVFLAVAATSLSISAVGLLLRDSTRENKGEPSPEPSSSPIRGSALDSRRPDLAWHRISAVASRTDWLDLVKLFYISMGLLLFVAIGTIEWEIDVVAKLVAQRPVWLYPTIIGVSSFVLLIMARRIVPGPWTATILALFYFGLRSAVTAFAEVVSGAPPRMTLVFILGALLLDLTCQWMTRFGFRPRDWQFRLAAAGAFMVGYTLVAQPTIAFFLLQYLPPFTVPDHLLTALFTFLLCAALYPVALGLGGWLQDSAGEESETPQEAPETVTAPAQG